MMQCKDITDEVMLAALASTRGRHGVAAASSLFDVRDHLGSVPPKVTLAKLRSMVKRGVITGCACGCRGDFGIARAA